MPRTAVTRAGRSD